MVDRASRKLVSRLCLLGLLLVGCSEPANTGKPKDPTKAGAEPALAELTRKAGAGDAQAQYELGLRYDKGVGVTKDAVKAVEWYRKSADQGFADAQSNLGEMYWYGKGVPKDAVKAVEWWHKAAEQGNATAQVNLGWMYEHGEGVPKDAVKAVEWWHKAAEQGDADAQFKLGVMYRDGQGVPKDAVKAVEWYRKSADQGFADAQSNLGEMYWYGKGVPKDAVKAVEWYRKAAEKGDAYSQAQLSFAYATGRGVKPNVVLGYLWINLAAAKDDQYVKYRDDYENGRGYISKRMDWVINNTKPYPEQIAEGQRLASLWKPGTNPEIGYHATLRNDGCEQHLLRLCAAPAYAPAPPPPAQPEEHATSEPDARPSPTTTGTGFVVSAQGHILTNHHVVADCGQVRLAGSEKPLKLLPKDAANDLALMQMSVKPQSVAVFRESNDLKQGEAIAVYGYPLEGALAAGGNLSPGIVSALAGLGNNTSRMQITAPIQPGNSGGPVLDGKGQVVGVVVQKLDALKVANLTGDVPQNVNFAVNEATTRAFLDSNQVPYKTGAWWRFWGKDLEDIAAEARRYTVVVECWR